MTTEASHPRPLSAEEVAAALEALPGWSHRAGALYKEVEFASFGAAMDFMMHAASEADALDHHPDWSNCHRRVRICLTTHAAGDRVTRVDLVLARRLQDLFPDA